MKFKFFLLTITICILSISQLKAQSCSYTQNTDAKWNNAENWSCGIVPNSSMDTVIIPVGTTTILESDLVFNGDKVLIVSGNINGNANNLIFNNNAKAEFTTNALVQNIARMKLGGTNRVSLSGNAMVQVDSINFYNNSVFITNSTECLVVDNFFEKGGPATLDGSGCVQYNGTEQNFKNYANGLIFGCENPKPNTQGFLSRSTCGISTPILEAEEISICLGTRRSVVVQVKNYINVDGRPINIPEIDAISILSPAPRWGQAELGNGSSFKITYTLDETSENSAHLPDTVRYQVNALGSLEEGLIIINEREIKPLTALTALCGSDLPTSLPELYSISEPNGLGGWSVNSELKASNVLDPVDLVLGNNTITYTPVGDDNCSVEYRDTVLFINPDASFSLARTSFCLGSMLDLSKVLVNDLGGSWSYDTNLVSVSNQLLVLNSTGNVNLTYTVKQDGCESIESKTLNVSTGSEIGYDAFNSSICKYAKRIDLNDRTVGNSNSVLWKVNGVEKNSFLPSEETSPVTIEYEITAESSCVLMGAETLTLDTAVIETEKQLLVLDTGTVLALSSLDYMVLFPDSDILSVSHENNLLSISVNKINTSVKVNIVELEETKCLFNENVTLFFEEKLKVEAGPKIELGTARDGNLEAPMLNYGDGLWSVVNTDHNLVVEDLNLENSNITVSKSGKSTLNWTVSTPGGQEGIDSTVVTASNQVRFPEAISPNGDGLNDDYEIIGLSPDDEVKLTVFNRWGQKLYESNDYINGGPWLGTDENGTALPVDTYMLTITINGRKDLMAVLLKK